MQAKTGGPDKSKEAQYTGGWQTVVIKFKSEKVSQEKLGGGSAHTRKYKKGVVD